MAVPKRRTSKRSRNTRRAHHFIKLTGVIIDKDTNTKRRSHRVNKLTGMYKGRQIMPAAA